MIVFTLIGIVIGVLFFGAIAAAGFFHALFNDIGGNGSRTSALCGIAVCGAGVYGIAWILGFSPLHIVVAP